MLYRNIKWIHHHRKHGGMYGKKPVEIEIPSKRDQQKASTAGKLPEMSLSFDNQMSFLICYETK